MAFTSLSASLNLDISAFANGLANATKRLAKFSEQVSNTANKSMNYSKKVTEQYAEATKELNKHRLGLKDVARIVQGIMVSQMFYSATRAIREAAGAVWEFNKSLDYARITYSALFGDTQLADDFMAVLKRYAIDTVFDYESLTEASKKLAAYGIEYKNLMYVMEGVTNLTTLTGDTAALDRISYALGQIYAKGKLSAQEMNQLANAYVPIQKILREKLGLTGEQISDIGKYNVPGDKVINAIVEYANEQFGSMADAAMLTISGLEQRIKETIKVAGATILQPLTDTYKSFLVYFSNGLDTIRAAINKEGIKGLFEALVPDPRMQTMIRQFVANLQNLFMSLVSTGMLIGKVFGSVIYTLVTAFNILTPPILFVVNTLGAVLNAVLSTRAGVVALRLAILAAAAAFVILRIHAISVLVITAVTKAVYGLGQALFILSSIITKPWVAVLLAITVGLTGLAVASGKANNALGSLFNTISSAVGGKSYTDVFTDTSGAADDATDAINQFNNALDGTGNNAEEEAKKTEDAAKKAKKAKDLLSFDEVFRLPDNSSSDTTKAADTTGGVLGDLEALASGFKGLGENLVPDIPDFSEFIAGFTDGLFGGLTTAFNGRLTDGALGAVLGGGIGAIIGGLLGNPVLGAAIGAFAGGLVGLLWDDIQKELGLSDTQGLAIGVAGAIGAVLGGAIGGPQGALIGAASGMLVSTITSMLWNDLAEEFGLSQNDADAAAAGSALGMAIGAVLGGAIGGAPGASIGAGIGTLVGGITGLLWSKLSEVFTESDGAKVQISIGTALGAIIGGLLTGGNPAGIAIGASIGSFASGLSTLLWDKLAEKFNNGEGAETANVGSAIGTAIGAIIGMLLTGGNPIGAAIGAAIGNFAGGFVGLFWNKIVENFTLLHDQWAEIFSNTWEDIKKAWEEKDWLDLGINVVKGILEGVVAALTFIPATAAAFFAGLWDGICEVFGIASPAKKMGPIGENIGKGILNGILGIFTDIGTWIDENILTPIKDAFKDFSLSNLIENAKEKFSITATVALEKAKEWSSEAWEAVKAKGETVKRTLSQAVEKGATWVGDAWSAVKTAAATVKRNLSQSVEKGTWIGDAWSAAKAAAATIKRKLSQSVEKGTWIGDAWTAAKKAAGTVKRTLEQNVKKGSTWVSDAWEAVKKVGGTIVATLVTNLTGSNKKADGGIFAGGRWHDIAAYASGGAPSMGQFFLAREAGPELVGTINGHTAVMNNDQIVASVASGVFGAVSAALGSVGNAVTAIINIIVDASNAIISAIGSVGAFNYSSSAVRAGVLSRDDLYESNVAKQGYTHEDVIDMANTIVDNVVSSILPQLATTNVASSTPSNLPPVYVGTLIADERGLKELERRMRIIRVQEERRGI